MLRRLGVSRRQDTGFTLIEVIVALSLLALISAAALALFVRGLSASASIERKQSAIALASSAIDQARAVAPADLVDDRTQTEVLSAWNASGAPDRALTLPAWDPTPAANTAALLPVISSPVVGNQAYTVRTLVGVCFRNRTSGTTSGSSAVCDAAGLSSFQTTPPSGYVKVYRVIVEVLWTSPTQVTGCSIDGCVYRVSTLIDANSDQLWNVKAGPVPNNAVRKVPVRSDAAQTTATDLAAVSSAGNVGPGTRAVVTSWSGPGQLFVDGKPYDSSTNYQGAGISYLPQVGYTGSTTLAYFLLNDDGQASASSTMTISVAP